MKCEMSIQHVAGLNGYEKIYLHFTKPENGFERILVNELNGSSPRYIAGREPKFSLYVGSPVPVFIEGDVVRQFTPSYKKFSWTRFWKELRTQNPSYSFSCRCGVWLKSDKSYTAHKRDCAVMKEFKAFMVRVENTKTYQEALDAGLVKRKKVRRKKSKRSEDPEAAAKLARNKRIAKAAKKVSKRRTS